MSLAERLLTTNQAGRAKIGADTLAIMDKATADLKAQQLADSAVKVGDDFVTTTLSNAQGNQVDLAQLLEKGPLIMTFYRGGWCPYCNLELKAFQALLPEIKAKGAQLVAITPETPDSSLTTTEKNELSFEVLTDLNNELAQQLGLVIGLPQDLQTVYGNFGIDLNKHNGNEEAELPMPATFVVNQAGKITYRFVSEDYTKRAEPSEVLAAL
ncbi:MAG: peroxiredoxin-like family protein [Aureispira sp.]